MKILCVLGLFFTAYVFLYVQPVETSDRNMVGCQEGEICWPKCCKANQYFDTESLSCTLATESEHLKQPDLHQLPNNSDDISHLKSLPQKNLTVLEWYGHTLYTQICNSGLCFLPTTSKYKFLSNGKLYVESLNKMKVSLEDFCIENFVNSTSGTQYLSAFSCSENSDCQRNTFWMENATCKDVHENEVG